MTADDEFAVRNVIARSDRPVGIGGMPLSQLSMLSTPLRGCPWPVGAPSP